jgi:hypothetical protein
MAATSKHYGDIYKWLEKVIDSSNTPLQEMVSRRLISLYSDRLWRNEEVNDELRHNMENDLRMKLDCKMYERLRKKLENGN